MSDAKAFGRYLPNDAMRDLCLNTAENLWANKQAVESGQLIMNGMAHASAFMPCVPIVTGTPTAPSFMMANTSPNGRRICSGWQSTRSIEGANHEIPF